MTVSEPALGAAAVCYPSRSAPEAPASSARLVLSALLWMVGAAAIFAISVVLAFVCLAAFRIGVWHAAALPDVKTTELLTLILATITIYGTFFLVSLRKARQVGAGDWRAGLGFGRVRRRGLVCLLGVALLLFVVLYVTAIIENPSLRAILTARQQDIPRSLSGDGVVFAMLFWAIAILLAPLAEELFFRGWLWTGLRRTRSPFATALITAVLWLSCHLADGFVQPIALIPAAVVLSLVRHYGASVRASMAVHFANNLFVPLAAVAVALILRGP